MNRKTWILLLALVAQPMDLPAQSELTRNLQQRLTNRKTDPQEKAKPSSSSLPTESAPKSDEATSQAPRSDDPGANFQATTPTEFADALHLAVISNNLEAFNGLVSWGTILKAATSQLQGKPIEEFRERFNTDVQSSNSLGAKIIQTVQAGGSYELLQLRKNENTVVALFRMLLPGGKGVNYHEYALAKTSGGKVVASDIYVYLNGETLSRSIRRNLVTALSQQESQTPVQFSGNDQVLSQNVETIEKLNEALAAKDANAAREQILKLPTELRADKAIQALTLNTYQNSSAFLTVLEGVRKSCPQDVFMDMIAIDVLVRQKKHEDAIVAIERIAKKVGGDPYLKILHGRMLLNQGENEKGRQMITEAVSEDDGILSGYWNLISFALEDQDHPETLKLLKKIHLRFKIKFKDLKEIPSYKHFVESEEFKTWSRYLESSEVSAPSTEPGTSSSVPGSSRRTASQSDLKAK